MSGTLTARRVRRLGICRKNCNLAIADGDEA